MADFRYTAVNSRNKKIQGVIPGASKKSAGKKIDEICRTNNLKLLKLEKKVTFLYKIQKGTEKPVKGEQKAFSKEDVVNVIQKMGFRILRIEKKLLDFQIPPPAKDVVMFIRITADLLREKLAYDEILELLMNDIENRTLRNVLKEIYQDLKDGKEGKEVFYKHQNILGKFPAYMLSIASTSGDMAGIYDNTAKFMERNLEFKKNIRQALAMPMIIIFFMLAAVVYYVAYIFPKTAELFLKYDIELPPMTDYTLRIAYFCRDNIWILLLLTAALFGSAVKFFRSDKGRLIFDRYLPRFPFIGPLLHKTSIEIFARVFNALYAGSGDNIAVLRVAAEACRNMYMEKRIKERAIPRMVKDGIGLVEALEETGVFTKNALSQLRSGAESGTLKMISLQLANYYEKETKYKMKTVIDSINVAISLFIMIVMIGLTVVSSETAVIKPENPMFGK